MQKPSTQAFILIAGVILALGAQAQSIYRCGNAYSQIPCQGAEPLKLDDPRQPEQRKQTDAAADQAARLAQTMEQTRIAEEKRLLAGQQTIVPAAPGKPEPDATPLTTLTPKKVRAKHQKPAAFIAEVPGSEKQVAPKKKPTNRTK